MELDRDLIFLEKLQRGRIENVLEELEDQFENEVLGLKFSFECDCVRKCSIKCYFD